VSDAIGFVLFVSGGRPSKTLVGAAKRKAKVPRIVKLKPQEPAVKETPSEEENDANFDANNDTADNSDNNEDANNDNGNDVDDDGDEEEDDDDDDDDDDDMKKKSEGSGEEKGTSSEMSHQPAIFRYKICIFTLLLLYHDVSAVMVDMNLTLVDIHFFIYKDKGMRARAHTHTHTDIKKLRIHMT
jgi:hypothetical protein